MSERVSVGSWPRRTLAGWLRRLADRLAPEREIRVHLTADTREFERAVKDAAEGLRRLTKQPASHAPGWSRGVSTGGNISADAYFTDDSAPPTRARGGDL